MRIGDGKKEPVRIMITSKSLLSFLKEKRGVAHIDTTYKITTVGYSLVVYGITDIQGRLHPVAFMLTSTESEEDFVNFYVGLNDLCKNMNIDYNPRFIMQDHCQASYNAAKTVYPDTNLLMCYFHVKLNMRKRLFHVLGNLYDEFETEVTKLHYSTTEEVYNQRLAIFRKKYINQKETMDYMNKVWLDSDFNKWQIFHNDPKCT